MFLQETKTKRGGKTYISYLVRESFRTANGPRGRTICNLTHLPKEVRDMVGAALKGESLISATRLELRNVHSSGGCMVLRDAATRYGLQGLLAPLSERSGSLVHAMVLGGLLFPPSIAPFVLESRRVRLAMFCGLDPEKEQFEFAELTAALRELDQAWTKVRALLPADGDVRALVLFHKPQLHWEAEMIGIDEKGVPVPVERRGETEELLQQIDRIWKSNVPYVMLEEAVASPGLNGHPYIMELGRDSVKKLREEMRGKGIDGLAEGGTLETRHNGQRHIIGRQGFGAPAGIRMASVTDLTSLAPETVKEIVAEEKAGDPVLRAVRTNVPEDKLPADTAMEWAARARTARSAFASIQIILGGSGSEDAPHTWRNHANLRFITHWLRAQMSGAWRQCGEDRDVEEVLRDLQEIQQGTLTIDGVTIRDVSTISSDAIGNLIMKLGLVELLQPEEISRKPARERAKGSMPE